MTTADHNPADTNATRRHVPRKVCLIQQTATLAALIAVSFGVGLPQAKAKPPRPHKTKTAPRTKAAKKASPKTVRLLVAGDGAIIAPPASLLPSGLPKPPPDYQKLVSEGKLTAFYDARDLHKTPVLSAPSALLMDADTGQILWAKNPDVKHYPASTTKIMTGLLFAEHTQPTDIITCLDPKITQIEESSLHIKPWEKFTAKDLLYGFILRSANDGAVVIAQHVGGSVPKFADMMNARAIELGATNTHFVTPNGLHDPNHYTTARDMALIARAALQNPRFAEAVRIPTRTISRSKLATDVVISSKAKKQFYDKFPGADGVKTGYTRKAQHCFVGSATRNGRRLLSIVLASRNSAISDTTPLLSWGFKRFGMRTVAEAGQPAPNVGIRGGISATVDTVAERDLHVSFDTLAPPGTQETEADTPTLQTVSEQKFAPIKKGDTVGYLEVIIDQAHSQTPLLAAQDVPASVFSAAVQAVSPQMPRPSGANSGSPLLPILGGAGALFAGLIGYRYYAATTTKSPRGRGGRLPSARGRTHRPRPGGR